MSGVILYQSRYGATRKYADWLGEATGFPVLEIKKAKLREVLQYDTVVLGSGVYASGIPCLKFLRKNWDRLSGKKLIVFCNGASPYDEKAFDALRQSNLEGPLADIPCFYCRGAWDLAGMKYFDRYMCVMLQTTVAQKKPEDREVWETALLEAGREAHDWTDRKYLEPVLEAIRGE